MNEPQQTELEKTLGLGDSNRSAHRYRRWAIGAGLLLLLGWMLSSGFAPKQEGVQYRSVDVRRGDLVVTVTATGTLQPLKQVEVGSELSGTIAEVLVDFNDEVEVGQVLARLDTELLSARLTEARASLQSAQAQVQQAQATVLENRASLSRCSDLAKRQMCSDNDLDAVRASYARAQAGEAMAKAQEAMARASLEQQETNLKKAVIRSPIKGIVLDRKIEPGQTVASSFQTPELFTLAEDLSQMELLVSVDEADIGKVALGMAANFSVDAYAEREFDAEVVQIRHAPQTVEGVVTYETVLRVENRDLSLLPGMTATAEIRAEELRDVVLIPNAALRFSPNSGSDAKRSLFSRMIPRPPSQPKRQPEALAPGMKRVWQLQNGEAVATTIKVGVSDGQWSQLLSGDVSAGTPLVVEQVANARD